MPIIQRGIKSDGVSRTFAAALAAGYTKIKSAEVDADLDPLYALVNGLLGVDNLAANSVGTSQLIAQAVTAAKIANGTITTAQLNAAAGILGSQLAANTLSTDRFQTNAGVPGFFFGASNSVAALTNTETVLLEGVSGNRTGTVIVGAWLSGQFLTSALGSSGISAIVQLREGGTVGVADGTVRATDTATQLDTTINNVPYSLLALWAANASTANAHFKLTVQRTPAGPVNIEAYRSTIRLFGLQFA